MCFLHKTVKQIALGWLRFPAAATSSGWPGQSNTNLRLPLGETPLTQAVIPALNYNPKKKIAIFATELCMKTDGIPAIYLGYMVYMRGHTLKMIFSGVFSLLHSLWHQGKGHKQRHQQPGRKPTVSIVSVKKLTDTAQTAYGEQAFPEEVAAHCQNSHTATSQSMTPKQTDFVTRAERHRDWCSCTGVSLKINLLQKQLVC